mmetsp:Transcript_35736/g.64357  ORF Transcript_35736/g.64357 Transcript_35736/m.64357 type:complete len:206 (-) Transcript_35736:1435-2052(-)
MNPPLQPPHHPPTSYGWEVSPKPQHPRPHLPPPHPSSHPAGPDARPPFGDWNASPRRSPPTAWGEGATPTTTARHPPRRPGRMRPNPTPKRRRRGERRRPPSSPSRPTGFFRRNSWKKRNFKRRKGRPSRAASASRSPPTTNSQGSTDALTRSALRVSKRGRIRRIRVRCARRGSSRSIGGTSLRKRERVWGDVLGRRMIGAARG